MELRQRLGRFQLSAGLRYEHVESEYFVSGQRRDEQCRTYDDFFPSLSVSTSAKNLQLSFSYAKRTTRPSYWQLSSDVTYENRLNQQTGNPYLQPVKYHNLNMMVMWKWLYLMTNFSHCVDPILYTAGSLEEDSKVNFVTYLNYDHADCLTTGYYKLTSICTLTAIRARTFGLTALIPCSRSASAKTSSSTVSTSN